jgi:malonyl-CoA O-methyltransferase
MSVDKRLVRERFLRSTSTYDRHATVQETMARRLAGLLGNTLDVSRPLRVLELGCGTGLLTRHLVEQLPITDWTGNDLADTFHSVSDKVRGLTDLPTLRFLEGDMEEIQLPSHVDLVVSNAAIQWLTDPYAFFTKVAEALTPDGTLAFATFGPGNLREIAATADTSLPYRCSDEYRDLLDSDFQIAHVEERESTLTFPTPVDVLQHLKRTGANALVRRQWTRGDLTHFSELYQRLFGSDQGVTLTFHPITLIAQKKS